jgi:NAD(P)-dependent dehydrogenase (short-subunit alcohol dehydrogenase family)
LKDKVCLITGASRGIGEAIARRFHQDGAVLSLCARNIEAAENLARSLDPSGRQRFGRIDVLVNCAGIIKHCPIDQMSLEAFESVLRVNLTGTFLACRAVVPVMKKQGRGKIVNMSSIAGRAARPGVGVNYAASKAGMIGLTRTLARELGPAGIYVNALAPGPILTELTKQVGPEVFATWNLGRVVNKDGLPEDVAEAVLFLASDRSDWITGVTLDINGGLLIC